MRTRRKRYFGKDTNKPKNEKKQEVKRIDCFGLVFAAKQQWSCKVIAGLTTLFILAKNIEKVEKGFSSVD